MLGIKNMGDYLRCLWRHDARRRKALVATLQLLARGRCEVLGNLFKILSQEVVRSDLVPEDWVRRESIFQVTGNADQVL